MLWPNTTTDIATFGAGSGAAGIVPVGTVTANGITFNPAGSGIYTLSGGTITLGGASPTITSNTFAVINSTIAGSNGLTKSGTAGGGVYLDGNNTYTGVTNGNTGYLIARHGPPAPPTSSFHTPHPAHRPAATTPKKISVLIPLQTLSITHPFTPSPHPMPDHHPPRNSFLGNRKMEVSMGKSTHYNCPQPDRSCPRRLRIPLAPDKRRP